MVFSQPIRINRNVQSLEIGNLLREAYRPYQEPLSGTKQLPKLDAMSLQIEKGQSAGIPHTTIHKI